MEVGIKMSGDKKKYICDLMESVMENTKECSDIIYINCDDEKKNIEIYFPDEENVIPIGNSDIEMVYDIVKVCMKHAMNKKKITY